MLWQKEVERILDGPLASRSDKVKINHVYIWAGAHAESLIEARTSEDPDIRITSPTMLLNQLAACINHPTFFREQREEFYNARQKPGENTTTYFSRIMDLYRQTEFPDNSNFLIVDKLIYGSVNRECKKKLKKKNVTTKECLEIMRRFELVEATMKKLKQKSHKEMDTSPSLTDPKITTTRMKGSLAFGVIKAHTLVTNVRLKMPRATSAKSKGISSELAYVEKARTRSETHDKDDKRLHNVNASDPESSGYEDNYDLNPVIIGTVHSQNAREVFAPVVFKPNTDSSATFAVQGKVDTGAMVSCMPVSMLPQIGLSSNDLTPNRSIIRGMSGTDLQNCGTVDINVMCNNITTKAVLRYETRLRFNP